MRILLLTIVSGVTALTAIAQPFRPPEPPGLPSPQQAYKQLLTVRSFAFGGVTYAGVTSEGEVAYRAIACSTNPVVLFSAVFTNGNAQAKLYALCGIRQFAPAKFDSYADSLRTANPKVETMQGCLIHHELAMKVISRVSQGSYDPYLKNAWR